MELGGPGQLPLQPPFSMIRRDVAASEVPWCAAHGTGVIVYSPMQSGLLTDSFTAERVASLPGDDWRRNAPHFQEPRTGYTKATKMVENTRKLESLTRSATAPDTMVAQVAANMAWKKKSVQYV